MLNSAISSGDRLPAIAASNIDWEDTLGREDLKDDGEKLKDAMEKAGVRPYVIIEKDGFRTAFFGIFGKQSDDYSPESGTMFREQIEAADDMVKTIKKEASPDLIVCLSHSGTAVNGAYSEDEVLAKAAPDVFENFKGDEKIEDEKLYRVVANLYSAQMLSLVNSMSKGLLSVVPKDRNGTPIENFEDHIICDSEGNELKEWYALSSYIDAFPDDRLPEYYSAPVSRKVEVSDSSLSGWFRKPNKYFWIIIGIAAALILAIISLIVIIVKIIKKIIGKRRPI